MPTRFTTPDGRDLRIKRFSNEDSGLLVDLFEQLSEETKQLRFHEAVNGLTPERMRAEMENPARIRSGLEVVLMALSDVDGKSEAVGAARFIRATPEDEIAEVAAVVRDDFQNQGLGTYLVSRLTPIARSMGVKQFVALVSESNRQMLEVFKKLDLPLDQKCQTGEREIVISL